MCACQRDVIVMFDFGGRHEKILKTTFMRDEGDAG